MVYKKVYMSADDIVLDDETVAFLRPKVRLLADKRTIAKSSDDIILEVGEKFLYGL